MIPSTVNSTLPRVELKVDAAGFGSLRIDGTEIRASNVRVEVEPGRGSLVRFEMLAEVECEISPDAANVVTVREIGA